ncbi:rhodopsin-like [Bombina bombina]|uniref:rhodopsin-like n=1 Tax=Bombina bombina TaxID=8345 RepID=UPI00235AF2E2|nr:rhodopsin-like [Bombina bombina]
MEECQEIILAHLKAFDHLMCSRHNDLMGVLREITTPLTSTPEPEVSLQCPTAHPLAIQHPKQALTKHLDSQDSQSNLTERKLTGPDTYEVIIPPALEGDAAGLPGGAGGFSLPHGEVEDSLQHFKSCSFTGVRCALYRDAEGVGLMRRTLCSPVGNGLTDSCVEAPEKAHVAQNMCIYIVEGPYLLLNLPLDAGTLFFPIMLWQRLWCCYAILTVVGNVAVLATAVKCSSHLKSPELLSINLAVTDLGMALSIYPLAIASAWNHAWLGGDQTCLYYALMGFLFGVASMMTLTAMAVIRYLVTASPRTNKHKIRRKSVYVLITCIWIYSLLWAIFPLLGWGYYGPEPFGISCTIAWSEFHNSTNGLSFIVSMFILCTITPAVTIITCYTRITWKLHKVYQEIQNYDKIPNAAKVEKKLTLMALLVSFGFLVSWMPYAAVSFWSIFNSSKYIPPMVSLLPCLFAKSSTAFNPIIYYMFSKSFRQKVKQLNWCCGWRISLLHTDNSAENPAVSVIWTGRENVHLSSVLKPNKENSISTTMP